jgi:flagellar biogenesis protein FliO
MQNSTAVIDSMRLAVDYGDSSNALFILLIKAMVAFALLALLYWILMLARKGRLPGFKSPLSSRRPMKVLSALSLGQRRQAVLLQVSSRVLLLGLGEGGVRTLGRFDGVEAEQLVELCDGDSLPFKVHLARGRRAEAEGTD